MTKPHASTQPISGIDVSVFQGVIDWKQVAASGQQFAYIKATEGVTYCNRSNLNSNWNSARNFHLKTGCYHFFHPADDPVDQANSFLSELPTNLKGVQLIPVVDIEETGPPGKDEWPRFTPVEGQARLESFCDVIKTAIGARPMLYCRTNWMEANWPGYVWNGPYWLAQYGTSLITPRCPAGWNHDNLKLWQYSCTGSVAGIKGAVDLNRFLGADLSEITL